MRLHAEKLVVGERGDGEKPFPELDDLRSLARALGARRRETSSVVFLKRPLAT